MKVTAALRNAASPHNEAPQGQLHTKALTRQSLTRPPSTASQAALHNTAQSPHNEASQYARHSSGHTPLVKLVLLPGLKKEADEVVGDAPAPAQAREARPHVTVANLYAVVENRQTQTFKFEIRNHRPCFTE